MENNNTNIISDEDFFKELLGESTPVTEASEENKTKLEEFLETGEAPEEGKPEETPPSDEDVEEIEETEKKRLSRFGVKDTINSLIENDVWVDMPVRYGEKEYENINDLLEKEKPSKELFDLLSTAQKQYRDNQIKENYVKVGDKDSTKAKLVNAILHDIDYTDLLEYNRDIVEPLQKIDFTSIKDGDKIAEAFVRQCLVEIDQYHPESIDAVVAKLKSEFRIVEKAEEYQKVTIDNFNREIEKRKLEKDEIIKKEENQVKEDIKNLRNVLKEQGIDDKFSNQMIKLRYTKDEKGKFHYENLIKDKIKDKDFEAKFLHFLLDEEDFITTAKSSVKKEVAKKYLELVNITPKDKGSKESSKAGNLQTDDEELFKELGLFK